MKKLFLIYLFLYPSICDAQIVSFIVRNDTLFGVDPGAGTYRQLTRVGGDSTKFVTNYQRDTARNNFYTNLAAKQNTIAVLPYSNGGVSAAIAAPATSGAMTINMTSSIVTITPSGACTFNASGGVAGQTLTFFITTSGTTSFTLTFGTNFRKTGTLATGTTNARFFAVTFRCLDGTTWFEISRTAAQT